MNCTLAWKGLCKYLKHPRAKYPSQARFINIFTIPLLLIKICVVNMEGWQCVQPPSLQLSLPEPFPITSERVWRLPTPGCERLETPPNGRKNETEGKTLKRRGRWRNVENRGRESGVSVEDTGTEGEVCGGHVGGHALLSPSFWPEFILPWRVSPICSSAEQQLCRSRCCCTPPHLLTALTAAADKIKHVSLCGVCTFVRLKTLSQTPE